MKTALKETSNSLLLTSAACRKALDTTEAARGLFERQQREEGASATASCTRMLQDENIAAYFLEAERRFETQSCNKISELGP